MIPIGEQDVPPGFANFSSSSTPGGNGNGAAGAKGKVFQVRAGCRFGASVSVRRFSWFVSVATS